MRNLCLLTFCCCSYCVCFMMLHDWSRPVMFSEWLCGSTIIIMIQRLPLVKLILLSYK